MTLTASVSDETDLPGCNCQERQNVSGDGKMGVHDMMISLCLRQIQSRSLRAAQCDTTTRAIAEIFGTLIKMNELAWLALFVLIERSEAVAVGYRSTWIFLFAIVWFNDFGTSRFRR